MSTGLDVPSPDSILPARRGHAEAPPRRDRLARRGKRSREAARAEAARARQPALRTDRLAPIHELLRTYREEVVRDGEIAVSPLEQLLPKLAAEVSEVEAWAEGLGRRAHSDGAAIRRALMFLRTFGRVTTLDFSSIPVEERGRLVALLALEHRWCYAAAGTTRDAFKIAIGRTGAR